jgi:hypothetical protein
MNNKLSPHNSVRLRVPASLESSRLPKQSHLIGEALDYRVDEFLLTLKRLFLSDLQTLVRPARIDQRRSEAGEGIAKNGIECRTKKRINAPFEMHKRS